jgi:hypothetical protein
MAEPSQSIELTTPDSIVVSIPHTGTRFLKERLGIADHIHTIANWVKLKDRIQDKQIIAPLRSPPAALRSWCRRRAQDQVLNWIGSFFHAWHIMHALDQLYEIDFICVDKQDDPRITDWTKVGDEDQSSAHWKPHSVDLRHLYKLPFVQRHYWTREQ